MEDNIMLNIYVINSYNIITIFPLWQMLKKKKKKKEFKVTSRTRFQIETSQILNSGCLLPIVSPLGVDLGALQI